MALNREPPVQELSDMLIEQVGWVSFAKKVLMVQEKCKKTSGAQRYEDEGIEIRVFNHYFKEWNNLFKKSVSQGKVLVKNNPEYVAWMEPLQQELEEKHFKNRIGDGIEKSLPHSGDLRRPVRRSVKYYVYAAIALYHNTHQTASAIR